MKKICALTLCLALIMSLAACGGAPGNAGGSSGSAAGSGSPASGTAVSLTGNISGEISVSCYDSMINKAFLEEAATLFESKYPGTKVNVESFSAMPEIKTSESGGKTIAMIQMTDDPQGRADYIGRVGTSLMSGGGADILAMDVLPMQKYVDGGQLENLSGYMEADGDFKVSDYRANILDAMRYKGGLWALPLDYSFDYYAYDSTLITGNEASAFGAGSSFTAQELVDIASKSFDGSSKMFNMADYTGGKGGMFGELLDENYSSFVDLENRRANFSGEFAKLLESIREYANEGYVSKGIAGQQNVDQIMQSGMEAPTSRYYYKVKNNFSLIQQLNKNSGMKMRMATVGVESGIEDDDEIAGIAADANGNVPFEYGQAYAINSNSKNKETAWAFIKFLLSEEMQLSTKLSATSLPLNNAARAQKAELMLSGSFMSGGQALTNVQQDVLDNYKDAIEQLSGQINTYTMKDSTINDMIAAEVKYFFSGEKSADEVAKSLQSKVGIYLGE